MVGLKVQLTILYADVPGTSSGVERGSVEGLVSAAGRGGFSAGGGGGGLFGWIFFTSSGGISNCNQQNYVV